MKAYHILLTAAVLLGACGRAGKDETPQTPSVKIATAQAAEEGRSWQLPGRVKASSEVGVAFKVSGTLKRVAVKEGQQVKAGQLLAEMDDTDYSIQLQATQAEYDGIKAEAGRVMELYSQQGTTAQNYDKARYGLRQIEAKLAHHANQLKYCRIYAPAAGKVQTVLFESGETVGQGMPVVKLVCSGQQEIEVSLPSHVYAHANDVVQATAVFSAYPGQVFTLRPLETLPKANATGLYTMRLAMEGTGLPSPGMGGWVTLVGSSQEDSIQSPHIMIPATALVHDAGEGDYVFTVEGGKAHKVAVTVEGLTGDGMARVATKLKAGAAVVASGAHHIKDGQAVQPLKPASKTNVGALL